MAGIPTVYSFLDLSGALVHPSFGAFQFTGESVGQLDVAMKTERTVHSIAADGTVMISKVAGNDGTVTIHCQQTSLLNKYLVGLYNYLIAAETSEWAQITAFFRNAADGTSHVVSGASFGKLPDKSYKSQGEMVIWIIMCADIQTLNV
jgi:hypothetical protein